jgi:hypothetical protein
MDDGSGIDFGDAPGYTGLEFVQRLHPDMPQTASRYFPEQGLDNVQP